MDAPVRFGFCTLRTGGLGPAADLVANRAEGWVVTLAAEPRRGVRGLPLTFVGGIVAVVVYLACTLVSYLLLDLQAVAVSERHSGASHGHRQKRQRITEPIWWDHYEGSHSAEALRLGKQTLCQLSYSRSGGTEGRAARIYHSGWSLATVQGVTL